MQIEKYKKQTFELAVENNIPILLVGETGTGKTTFIKKFADDNKKNLIRLSLNDQTGREDLIGKWGLVDGNTVWIDGPLLKAMRDGDLVVLDELNSARPEILFALHSITDHEKNILLQEKDNELVKSHKDFRLFACMNPITYHGTKNLNQAFMSRFCVIDIQTLSAEKEYKLVKKTFPGIDSESVNTIIGLSQQLRDYKETGEIEYFCSTRDVLLAAHFVDRGLSLPAAVKYSIINKMDRTDVEYLIEELGFSTLTQLLDKIQKTSPNYETLLTEVSKLETRISDLKTTKENLLTEIEKIKLSLSTKKTELKSKIEELHKLETDASEIISTKIKDALNEMSRNL